MSLLQAKNLGLFRGEDWLFRQLNFSVSKGACCHIQGPNGSGKTTLLRVLAGLTLLDEGEVAISDPTLIPYFFASPPALLPELSVWEYCGYQLALLWEQMPTEGQIKEALSYWEISHLINQCISTLSQGQQQRVALTFLSLNESPLWLLDEPARALDAKGLEKLWSLCRDQQLKGGGVLFTSHQLPNTTLTITDNLHL